MRDPLREPLRVPLRDAVPLRRRVLHAFLAAALRFALVIRTGDLRAVRFAGALRPLRLRVAAAFFAEVLRFAALRLRVAAAFFAEVLRFAALRLRVAAAFFAEELRFAAVERFAGALRPLRFRVAAAFLAAALRFAAFRFRVAAAFFAEADLVAFVPAIFFTIGGLTRTSLVSVMEGPMKVGDISGMSSNSFICLHLCSFVLL